MSTCTHLQHNLITFDQFNFANGDVRVHPEKSTQLWRQFVKGESYFDGGIFGCHVRNELGSLCTWSFPLFVFSLSLIRTGCDIRAAVKYLLQTRLTLRACGLQWREITDGICVEFLSGLKSFPIKRSQVTDSWSIPFSFYKNFSIPCLFWLRSNDYNPSKHYTN